MEGYRPPLTPTVAATHPPDPPADDPWDVFDRIYCISLSERADRQREARAQFDRVGLSHRVEFLLVSKHPADPEEGIFTSHRECLRRGLDAGAETILVFEDDILFDRFSGEALRNAAAFMAAEPGWDILFMGCLVKGIQKTPYPSVVKIRYRCSAHAYAVRRRLAEVLAKRHWEGMAWDDLLREASAGRAYALSPAIAFQSDSPTDNDALRGLDRFRRLCGGIRRVQKLNEWYHRHKTAVIAAHLLAVTALLLTGLAILTT
jgi:hypothetical protein